MGLEAIPWGDVATWTTMLAAMAALFVSSKASIQHKRIEVLLHFYHRYDTLASEKDKILAKIESLYAEPSIRERLQFHSLSNDIQNELRYYSKRFWSLQYDQFDLWTQGYVDFDTYKYWVSGKKHSAEKAREAKCFELDAYLHAQSWELSKMRWDNTHFQTFMSALLDESELDFDKHLAKYKPPIWRRLGVL